MLGVVSVRLRGFVCSIGNIRFSVRSRKTQEIRALPPRPLLHDDGQ